MHDQGGGGFCKLFVVNKLTMPIAVFYRKLQGFSVFGVHQSPVLLIVSCIMTIFSSFDPLLSE